MISAKAISERSDEDSLRSSCAFSVYRMDVAALSQVLEGLPHDVRDRIVESGTGSEDRVAAALSACCLRDLGVGALLWIAHVARRSGFAPTLNERADWLCRAMDPSRGVVLDAVLAQIGSSPRTLVTVLVNRRVRACEGRVARRFGLQLSEVLGQTVDWLGIQLAAPELASLADASRPGRPTNLATKNAQHHCTTNDGGVTLVVSEWFPTPRIH